MNFYVRSLGSIVSTTIFWSCLGMMPAIADTTSSCKLRAYVIDTESDLLNVRQQPNSRSKILGKLPSNAEIRILKTAGNWVLITPGSPATQNLEWRSPGWVFTSFLGLSTRGYGKKSVAIFRKANANSGIAGRIPANTEVKLQSCQGEWVLIERQGVRGWLAPQDQCAAAATTCS